MMNRTIKTLSAVTAACLTLTALPCQSLALGTLTLPVVGFNSYQQLLSENPDGYVMDGDSVYFFNHNIQANEMNLVVSSNSNASISFDTYGVSFTPEMPGSYVVTVLEYCEEPQDEALPLEWNLPCQFEDSDNLINPADTHCFRPQLYHYTVTKSNAGITVETGNTETGSVIGGTDFPRTEHIINKEYLSYAVDRLPELFSSTYGFVTNLYNAYEVKSYFTAIGKEKVDELAFAVGNIPEISNPAVAQFFTNFLVTDEVLNRDYTLYTFEAIGSGATTILVDGNRVSRLQVSDRIFHNADIVYNAGFGNAFLIGDADLDGKITMKDVSLVLDYYGKNAALLEAEAILGRVDINENGKIDIQDVNLILETYASNCAEQLVDSHGPYVIVD